VGLWGRLFGRSEVKPFPAPITEPLTYTSFGMQSTDAPATLDGIRSGVVEGFWRTQPNLRKVVDFIARNVASIPLHVYERVSDTDRRRVRDGELASVIARPVTALSAYRFWHAVVSDSLLYDRWAALVRRDAAGVPTLIHLPSSRLGVEVDEMRSVRRVAYYGRDGWQEIDRDDLIFDYGYSPNRAGMSPIETLKDILDESAEAMHYRRQVWANGARASSWVKRPKDAGKWDSDQRRRFGGDLRAAYTGDGPKAGGIPVLEDGMELHDRSAMSSDQLQDLEGRKLSAIEVAAYFHVAPELVGAQQGNYSNVREYRQMLYRDSLGPYIKALEDVLNAQLVPMLGDDRVLYIEANVEAKLRGDFMDQAQALQSSVGRPWMSADEARARMNMPAVGGEASRLVVPLNVLTGGQASPNDSGSQNRSGRASGPRVKIRGDDPHVRKHDEEIRKFFGRQARVIRSALGVKVSGWWDKKRWDKELKETLLPLYVSTAADSGRASLDRAGLPTDAYDESMTVAFMTTVAERVAEQMNEVTKDQLDVAIDDDDPSSAVGNVFDIATDSRSEQAAQTTATFAAAFGVTESAKQYSGGHATKTWRVMSSNPRPSHAAMDGETVDIDSKFSNGADWPADGNLDAAESANCTCAVDVNY
jgi:HK97 family phage portal protein